MSLVSIVIPIFNTEQFIERCLLSLIEQTCTDIEIICVDDMSTDGSKDIVRSFARSDPRIRLLSHTENRHAGGARNSGIRAAKSNYILAVDSDDYVDADLVERAYEATDKEAVDIVCFGYRSVDLSGNVLKTRIPRDRTISGSQSSSGRLLITEPAPWNKLVRRRMFTEDNLWFPESTYWEDLATVPRLLFKARDIRFLGATLYSYVDRPGSHVNQLSARHLVDYLRVFDILKHFLVAEGVYESERADFENLVMTNFAWYAERLSAPRVMDPAVRAQSVRYCALLARAYILNDDALAAQSPAENLRSISGLVPGGARSSETLSQGNLLQRMKSLWAPRKPTSVA